MSRKASIEAVSLVGRILYNTQFNVEKNPFCCVRLPQAIIPLSYAAQVSTTPNPDLANVRLSVSYVDHQVQ